MVQLVCLRLCLPLQIQTSTSGEWAQPTRLFSLFCETWACHDVLFKDC